MHILLADDQPSVRFALRVLLEQQHALHIAGEALDAADLLTQVRATHPDLVLLGWELPGLKAKGLITALRQAQPGLFIIALSGHFEARHAALAAGADAFVSKGDPPDKLLAAIAVCQHVAERGRAVHE
jgi:DNA-binding NarL/FixJ family response regulator